MFLKSRLPGNSPGGHRNKGKGTNDNKGNDGGSSSNSPTSSPSTTTSSNTKKDTKSSGVPSSSNGDVRDKTHDKNEEEDLEEVVKVAPITMKRTIPVFGTPLKELYDHDRKIMKFLKVPLFFREAVKHIITKGMYEKGVMKHAGSGPEVQDYRSRIDGGTVDFSDIQDIFTVSSLLKAFLRELPEPLLTTKLYSKWLSIPDIENDEKLVSKVQELLSDLPEANQHVLGELMRLLFLLDLNSANNDMTADELSSILGKDLLWKGDREKIEFTHLTNINDLIRIMIIDYEILFEQEEEERCSEPLEIAEVALFKRKMLGHEKSINCIEQSTNGRIVWTGDSSGVLRVWAAEDMKFMQEIKSDIGRCSSLKSVGKDIWCGGEKQLEVRDERGQLKLTDPISTFAIAPIFESNGQVKEVWVSVEGKIKIWDANKLVVTKEISFPSASKWCLVLKQVGDVVWGAFADKSAQIRIWNTKSRQISKELSGHSRKVNDIILVGDKVWTSSDDRGICVWNAKTFDLICTLKKHTGFVYGLMYTGKHVWSASWDKSVVVWDADKLLPLVRLTDYHTDAVSALTAHYNQSREAWMAWSASFDHSVCVWEMPECSLREPEVKPEITEAMFGVSPSDDLFTRSIQGSRLKNTVMLHSRRRTGMMSQTKSMLGEGSSSGPDDGLNTQLARWEIGLEDIKDKGDTLGTGSFGTVYKAKLFGKEVAVKQLFAQKIDDKALDEFKKEVAIMSTLRHPNVLLFMGACCNPACLLIVTEVMPQGSVHDIIRDPTLNLSFKRKMLFAKDAAMGVNWLHSFNPKFLHLDLKAANLLVDHKWTVKVADFGLSVVKKSGSGQQKEKHGPIGTPLWMAPEVLMNKEYDEKADVYSFGIVMYELLTGKDPWEDIESLVDLVEAVCMERRRPPLPKEIPNSLKDLINLCWHPEQDKRPPFADIVNRFDEIIIDGCLKETMARQLWRKNFLGKVKVPWIDFAKALCTEMRINYPSNLDKDTKFSCLKAVLGKKEEREQNQVTIEAFSAMLEWFGPMEDGGMLDRVFNLLKQPYFFGDISAKDAEYLLMHDKKKGSFILRFSTHDPGCYALTVNTQNSGLKHYRVMHKAGQPYSIGKIENGSLEDLLKKYSKELELRTPCAGSPYYSLVYAQQNKVEQTGYKEVDFNL